MLWWRRSWGCKRRGFARFETGRRAGRPFSLRAGADFWRMDEEMPEMIRWIRWGKANFMLACDMVHFEYGTQQR